MDVDSKCFQSFNVLVLFFDILFPIEAKVLSDGEIDSETEAKCQPPPNALSSFMASYNSDSEDEVEEGSFKN